MDDEVRFESIAGSEDDELDSQTANGYGDAIYSAQDPDDTTTEDSEDEE